MYFTSMQNLRKLKAALYLIPKHVTFTQKLIAAKSHLKMIKN